MTIDHPEWMAFFLEVVGDLDFRDGEYDKVLFDCDGTFDKSYRALKMHKGVDIPKTLEYFEENHANCDCEVVLNIPGGRKVTDHETEKAVQES